MQETKTIERKKRFDTSIYKPGDDEYNLLNMLNLVVQQAFAKHYSGKRGFTKVAEVVGVSDRTLYDILDRLELRHLLNQSQAKN